MRGYTLLRNVTSQAGDSKAIPRLDHPGFHCRALPGQGTFSPLNPRVLADGHQGLPPLETGVRSMAPDTPLREGRAALQIPAQRNGFLGTGYVSGHPSGLPASNGHFPANGKGCPRDVVLAAAKTNVAVPGNRALPKK